MEEPVSSRGGDKATGRGWEVVATYLWFSYNSVLRLLEFLALCQGVCPGWEVSIQGDPRPGVGGFRTWGLEDKMPGPALLTRGALGGSTGR